MVTNTPVVRQSDVRAVAEAISGGAALVDVRETFEFESGHVDRAVSMPMHLVPLRLDELTRLAAGKPVYVMCHSGNRSWQVCHYLGQHGIDAVNVAGGVQAWRGSGLPLTQAGDRVSVGGAR